MRLPADSLYSSVTYIPLETTDESLFYGIDKLLIHDDVYYLPDAKQDVILAFNGKGKYLRKLSRKGQGTEEYLSLDDFFIDDSLLYALSSDSRKILIHDLNFNVIKSFATDAHVTNRDFSGDNIFVFTNFCSPYNKNIHVVDKTNGEINNRMVDCLEKQQGVSYGSLPFAKWNDSLYMVFPYDLRIFGFESYRLS
jgi:hypothetical protein